MSRAEALSEAAKVLQPINDRAGEQVHPRKLGELTSPRRRDYRLNLLPALRRLDYHLFYAVQDDPNSDMRTVIVSYPDFDPNVPVDKLPPPITIRYPQRAKSAEEWMERHNQTLYDSGRGGFRYPDLF